MGRRCTKWRHEFCTDVDAVLRVGTGLTESRGALWEEARREGTMLQQGITSARGGLVATAEEEDGEK